MMSRKQFLLTLTAVGASAEPLWEASSEFFKIAVATDEHGVWLSRFIPAGVTHNLTYEKTSKGIERSCTGILPANGQWWFSELPSSGNVSCDGQKIRVAGIQLGPASNPIARENWSLRVSGDTLTWQVEREFLRDVHLVADRFPVLVFRIAAGGHYLEIPGFLDTSLQLDGTSMFPLHASGVEHYEAISPRRVQGIHLAPSGITFESTLKTGFFSYAKRFADGTAGNVALGAGTVNRTKGPEARTKETRETQLWTLRRSSAATAEFDLVLPDQFLAEQSRSFANVHNQWMGWLFGNNPASVPVLQELAWFPMVQSVFSKNAESLEAMAKELLFFSDHGVEADGFVFPRWGASGFYRAPWGKLIDQVPMFILAAYSHAMNSGDRDFVRQLMPTLHRVYLHMMAFDADNDGVFESPGSGLADGGRHCSGWFDIVNFGHKDALINAWCVGALDALAQLASFVGDAVAAARYRAAHVRCAEAYNRILWDDTRDLYMDWIDVREKMPESGRRYFYTDHNMLAIIFGIADASKAQRILAHLDRRYQALCHQFSLSRDAIYATPCNMYPVSQLGDLVDFGELQNQKVYPNYENGCSFFHSTGLEIAARGMAGQADVAYQMFERVMRFGYARNRLWGAALKWDTGELISEPLNNALLILWGFVQGCFGVRRSLTGVRSVGPVATQLEGARHTFCHLGHNVSVHVEGGRCLLG